MRAKLENIGADFVQRYLGKRADALKTYVSPQPAALLGLCDDEIVAVMNLAKQMNLNPRLPANRIKRYLDNLPHTKDDLYKRARAITEAMDSVDMFRGPSRSTTSLAGGQLVQQRGRTKK